MASAKEGGTVSTDTFELRGRQPARSAGGAGLVTLYAPRHADVPAAIPLSAEATVIGRDPPRGGIRLPFGSVSRVHVRARWDGDHVVVEDLKSRNGTLVNGRLAHSARLAEGDELRVGETLFKVVASGVESYSAFPLDGVPVSGPTAVLRGGWVMSHVRDHVVRIARGALSVLVTGETGTGKELVAQAIHEESGRPGPLRAVNCAAIPAQLLESELFGYRRGAFTGADRNRVGIVKSADKGTLLLDEIGDMPLEAQAKLLRLLETRQVTPLGSHQAEHVDVRIVCATHRPLAKMVQEDRFRADLYARIAGHAIRLPPLRDRKEDVYQLTRFFVASTNVTRIDSAFMLGLCAYDWPFNVRELASAVQRAVTMSDGALGAEHLPDEVRAVLDQSNEAQEAPEQAATSDARPSDAQLRAILVRHAGNVAAVARELGKDRRQVHRWLKRSGLSPTDYRG